LPESTWEKQYHAQARRLLERQLAWFKETEIRVAISGADSKELAKDYAAYGLHWVRTPASRRLGH
jgi:hypothetical protein